MESANRLDSYLAILEIRKKAYYRNVLIGGGMFFLVILATTGTLLLTDWNVRSIWLMGIFEVLFTANFVMTWARYEIITETIELINNLQIQDR